MNPKEDDEITIDFSKIKNFFKSDKKEESKAEAAKEGKSDDDMEISLDFAKIKKFFKSGEDDAKESGGDINVNWGSVIGFFRRYGVVFIALIPIILSIYVRMQAGSLAFADNWAVDSVINGIKNQIRAEIDRGYPNLPDSNKNAIMEPQLQKVLSENGKQVDEQIRGTSAYLKSFFQDETGKNYMPDIDPYYWARYAKNIVEHGHPGDILRDGRPYDTLQVAPIGRIVFPDMFHAYSLAYFYKIVHVFVPDLSVMRSTFYLPVVVSALCVLLVFLIARKIAGNSGGFFAGLIMAVNGAFLGRTLFGHPDNDIWVIFFPLLVTWLFVATIDAKNSLKVVLISLLAGFFTGIFPTAWSGWWYIFDFLLATVFFTALYIIFTNLGEVRKGIRFFYSEPAIRNILIVGIVYFVSTLIFISLFSGFNTFKGSFLGPLKFPSIKNPVSTADLWPNVLTTVAELNEGSINAIINSIGGPFLFYISLLGLVLSISRENGLRKFDFFYILGTVIFYGLYFLAGRLNFDISVYGTLIWIMLPVFVRIWISIYKKDSSYDFKLSILLSLWIVSTIFASIKGIRFTLLLAPAFSVAFGVSLGKIYHYAMLFMAKELKVHKAVGGGILIVLLLLAYINPVRGAISAAGSDLPIINDAWYNSLNAIKQGSDKNAIITSWWDFGHHFKALAERRVTFDGTTQTFPAAHWVGRLLMTSNESEALGILRMLDCGSNSGFNELFIVNNDHHLSVKILNEIIVLDRNLAAKKLRERGFNNDKIEKVLSYTHCSPPEAYFIASNDMIGKSGVWSHFGSWNFERADIWKNARGLPPEQSVEYMVKKFNYTKERAENIYDEIEDIENEPDVNRRDRRANEWIAPWPGYGGVVGCSKNSNKNVYECSNGFQINLSNNDVFAIGQQGIVRLKVAAFTTEDGLLFRQFNGTTVDFGLTIIPKSENELQAVLSSKELAGSMFTRMFYMQGHGLRYFKLFNHQRIFQGSSIETNVYTYKVDWEGKNTTIVNEYVDALKKQLNEEAEADSVSSESNSSILNMTSSS